MPPSLSQSPSDSASTERVIASDGRARRSLRLKPAHANGAPVLVDDGGTPLAPWEVELLRWPVSAEKALRRGGYLTDRYPPIDEPWCNCAD